MIVDRLTKTLYLVPFKVDMQNRLVIQKSLGVWWMPGQSESRVLIRWHKYHRSRCQVHQIYLSHGLLYQHARLRGYMLISWTANRLAVTENEGNKQKTCSTNDWKSTTATCFHCDFGQYSGSNTYYSVKKIGIINSKTMTYINQKSLWPV